MSRDIVLVAGRDPLDELGGGHSSYVRAHARAVLRLGLSPHLFCAGRDDAEIVTDYGVIHRSAARVRPVRQSLAGLHAPRIAAAIARFASGSDGRARGGGPLLVHAFGVWGVAGVLACARLRAAGREAIPIVSSYTAYASESRSLLRFAAPYGWRSRLRYGAAHLWIRLAVAGWERRAYCESERVLLNYESVRSLVAARYGAAARCVKLTYAAEAAFLCEGPSSGPGVEIGSHRAPRSAQAGAPPLIVAVSRHDPRKGWDVLLAALDRLRRQGVPFRACLAGGGPQLAADRALARRLGLGGGSVEILGEVPDSFALLRRADVFVLPSRAEQSGSLSLLEALQAGCAVVASRVDGIPEDVTDGASALLVEPGDPAALAGALARLLGDAGLRRRLGTAARKVFEERFSAAVFAAALGRVYAELGVVAEAQEPPRSEGARAGGSR